MTFFPCDRAIAVVDVSSRADPSYSLPLLSIVWELWLLTHDELDTRALSNPRMQVQAPESEVVRSLGL